MRKAKDYAKQFQDSPTTDTLAIILTAFLHEASELANTRKISSDSAAIAIFREQDNKWRALSRMCPSIPENLFEQYIKDDAPDIYRAWKG